MKIRNSLIAFALASVLLMAACTPSDGGGNSTAYQPAAPSASAGINEEEALSPGVTEERTARKDSVSKELALGEFKTKDINGNEVDQSIFKEADLTVINIWATYCGACLKSLPYYAEINEEYKDKGVQVIGIVVDLRNMDGSYSQSQIELAQEISEATGATYAQLMPSDDLIQNKLQYVSYIPETLIVDKDGVQIGKSVTGARSKRQWTNTIDELLDELPEREAPDAITTSVVYTEDAEQDPFFSFNAVDLEGKAVTEDILDSEDITIALVWNPAWEGSAEALKKMQEYIKRDSLVNGIGFVLGENQQDAKQVVAQSGVTFEQIVPDSMMLKNIPDGEGAQVMLISPWGAVNSYFSTELSLDDWEKRVNFAFTDFYMGCCA